MFKGGPYILPLRLDDSQLVGLIPTVAYLDLRKSSLDEVCRLLVAKLGNPRHGSANEQATEAQKSTLKDVVSACYRRAVFTRYHAQLSREAMFSSLADCRGNLQRLIAYVEPLDNKRLVAGIIAELDLIERIAAIPEDDGNRDAIDKCKLRIISALSVLATRAGSTLILPVGISEEVFFDDQEANAPPTGYVAPGNRPPVDV